MSLIVKGLSRLRNRAMPAGALLACALLCVTATGAGEAAGEQPDVLLLALDGVPVRVAEAARERGAFRHWTRPSPLVSTFPSTTHVAFTALFEPFGVGPADGYELRYFSKERNEMVGGSPLRYREQAYDWKGLVDIKRRTLWEKLMVYVSPKRTARREMANIAELMLGQPREVTLAHVGSTDALQHIRGDEAAVRFLVRLEASLEQLKRRYLERHGRRLSVVLYSDHGNGDERVRKVRGVKKLLRREGFRVKKRLRRPDDVVAPTFGIVSYGALFLEDADRAERAARAVVRSPGVELAAWRTGPEEVRVVSADGAARIRWRDAGARRWLAYAPEHGDPLRYGEAVERLGGQGELDAAGFATREAWLRATVDADYPDGPGRLVTALSGHWIKSRATVLLSLRPGYAWGLRTAHIAARVQGGRVRGTHGGLDAESSLGFWMTDDPALGNERPYVAERALARFAAARAATLAAAAR